LVTAFNGPVYEGIFTNISSHSPNILTASNCCFEQLQGKKNMREIISDQAAGGTVRCSNTSKCKETLSCPVCPDRLSGPSSPSIGRCRIFCFSESIPITKIPSSVNAVDSGKIVKTLRSVFCLPVQKNLCEDGGSYFLRNLGMCISQ
jgi:hypothetical protein